MRIYIASLILGFIVGIIYYLVNVRSPAPPIWALLGLLGMVIGEQCIPYVKQHYFNDTAHVQQDANQSTQTDSDNSSKP